MDLDQLRDRGISSTYTNAMNAWPVFFSFPVLTLWSGSRNSRLLRQLRRQDYASPLRVQQLCCWSRHWLHNLLRKWYPVWCIDLRNNNENVFRYVGCRGSLLHILQIVQQYYNQCFNVVVVTCSASLQYHTLVCSLLLSLMVRIVNDRQIINN